ncbi:MFS-type transporter SLC18B1-like [Limulus polyphemus]|uniref:MFS-type transporter SLC18B1-like n=1 Tax=Limulus polyphemus TaxID=6850 RepID=A0ABM1TRK4_LIMPO|nr:MFS-type transporter SLC18B1-like [Limulus polyphemus]
MVPFFVLGGILITLAFMTFLFLPESEKTFQEESGDFIRVILDMGFFVDMLNILTGLLFIGFNEATLEPHIRQFDLEHSTIGLIFVVCGGVYVCGTLFWGYVSDRMPRSRSPLLFASVLFGASCLLLGPAPFISMETYLWMVIVAQGLMGLGSAAKLVVGFNHSLQHTISRGFPDDIPTIAVVAAAFNCVNSLGEFIGPSIGGALVENVGYKSGTMVLLGIEMAVVLDIPVSIRVAGQKVLVTPVSIRVAGQKVLDIPVSIRVAGQKVLVTPVSIRVAGQKVLDTPVGIRVAGQKVLVTSVSIRVARQKVLVTPVGIRVARQKVLVTPVSIGIAGQKVLMSPVSIRVAGQKVLVSPVGIRVAGQKVLVLQSVSE